MTFVHKRAIFKLSAGPHILSFTGADVVVC